MSNDSVVTASRTSSAREAGLVPHRQHEVDDVGVLDLDALGPPGRARRVDHVGRRLRAAAPRCRRPAASSNRAITVPPGDDVDHPSADRSTRAASEPRRRPTTRSPASSTMNARRSAGTQGPTARTRRPPSARPAAAPPSSPTARRRRRPGHPAGTPASTSRRASRGRPLVELAVGDRLAARARSPPRPATSTACTGEQLAPGAPAPATTRPAPAAHSDRSVCRSVLGQERQRPDGGLRCRRRRPRRSRRQCSIKRSMDRRVVEDVGVVLDHGPSPVAELGHPAPRGRTRWRPADISTSSTARPASPDVRAAACC